MTEPSNAVPPRIGAVELAELLQRNRPTDEQRAVIEAPLEPALVVAGAGSGKTETMSFRVLWLVANGLVAPQHVLGLTFTRKAASELADRIRRRIDDLAKHGLAPQVDEFAAPTVLTYNAFANGIYREWAATIGREPGGVVLGDASAWQLARTVVIEADLPELGDLDLGVDRITELVLRLAGELGEHVADPAAVAAWAESYRAAIEALPNGPRGSAYREEVGKALRPGVTLPLLLGLVTEFQHRKRARGQVQYADQVALALEILGRSPAPAQQLRDRYRVVLLDEYQDTSVVQTRLLTRLFAGQAVMAVGDPHQSIYGWRGASAGNLGNFGRDFGARGEPFTLSISWRNGRRILDVANTLAAPLTRASRVAVPTLTPAPSASDHAVEAVVTETLTEEADTVARWFRDQLGGPGAGGSGAPSAALLMRARRTLPVFLAAFREHGVPYHVLGVGGLTQEPEVADLVAALRVIDSPHAGAELVRLLAGARWRIGTADLAALSTLARRIAKRDFAGKPLDAGVAEAFGRSLAVEEEASIVDALDLIATRRALAAGAGFTEQGLARLEAAGRLFASLRRRSAGPVQDFVHLVIEELALDVETLANPARNGLRALHAFDDALTGFLQASEGGSLGAFLGWLELAERKEDLQPRADPPEPGTVQVLTVHGAKGLEWDLVAVPRLAADEFPAKPHATEGWLTNGVLPWEFRGDAAELPTFPWRSFGDRRDLRDASTEFKAAVGARQRAEERRLAYVAVTRARHRLLLSASFWATQIAVRGPGEFLRDLAEAGLVPPLPAASAFSARPEDAAPERFQWPADPLGSRRGIVEASAALVRQASPNAAGRWTRVVDALLAERAERLAGTAPFAIPARVPASRFKDYADDARAVLAAQQRPMPQRPYTATRLGTQFHTWVEEQAKRFGATELMDSLPLERDEEIEVGDADLGALQATFLASPWGGRTPVAVELEIQLPFEGHILVCKIDAVYEQPGGRIEIVDWKTGRAPRDARDLELKQLQLALYRLAYARLAGIDPSRIDAAFYFVAEDRVIRPAHIDSEEQLRARWRAAVASLD